MELFLVQLVDIKDAVMCVCCSVLIFVYCDTKCWYERLAEFIVAKKLVIDTECEIIIIVVIFDYILNLKSHHIKHASVFEFLCYYNGVQKCWDLSSQITKNSDPSPPTPNIVEFGAKWVKLSAFFGHNIARGSLGGGDGMNPKPN